MVYGAYFKDKIRRRRKKCTEKKTEETHCLRCDAIRWNGRVSIISKEIIFTADNNRKYFSFALLCIEISERNEQIFIYWKTSELSLSTSELPTIQLYAEMLNAQLKQQSTEAHNLWV